MPDAAPTAFPNDPVECCREARSILGAAVSKPKSMLLGATKLLFIDGAVVEQRENVQETFHPGAQGWGRP